MEKVFGLLKKATAGEIAGLITLLIAIITAIGSLIMYVEDRYAKEKQIKEQQALIEKQKDDLKIQEDQLINMFNSLPENIRKEIGERNQFAQQFKKSNPSYVPNK